MKDQTEGPTIEEFFRLKPKMYMFLVYEIVIVNIKKQKVWMEIFFATISHCKYKDVLLNKKCLRHSMNRIQSKDHRIGTYEINKISLSCFDDKTYIQISGYDGLALGCQSSLQKSVILIIIEKQAFLSSMLF